MFDRVPAQHKLAFFTAMQRKKAAHSFFSSAHNSIGETPISFTQEDFIISNACTNSGCDCTPNQSIKCTVNNCAHHCQNQDYCGLTSITVGTHETNPTKVECTDCQSFELK